jgi:small multidrug resistance family-3 protein
LIRAIVLFLVAGLAEIGGGYAVWLCLKEEKSFCYGIVGCLILCVYGIIPTFQSFPNFGRVYAAYGGVFIVMSLLWGWGIDRKMPDTCDWIGAFICVIGVYVMLWGPRQT